MDYTVSFLLAGGSVCFITLVLCFLIKEPRHKSLKTKPNQLLNPDNENEKSVVQIQNL
jgi:hypothetical protein